MGRKAASTREKQRKTEKNNGAVYWMENEESLGKMSRTAQDVLEFDKLRELLRLRTTCAPGRRDIDALQPGRDREALETSFALIREAMGWLRGGNDLGFGALSDPGPGIADLEAQGTVLEAKE